MIPIGAESILDARLRGRCPADPVLVMYTGRWSTYQPWVRASASRSYEWEWARGLDLFVVAESDPPLTDQILEIGKVTGGFRIWFSDLDRGWEVSVWPDNVMLRREQWQWSIHHWPMDASQSSEAQQFVRENIQ